MTLYLCALESCSVVAKLDFANAFNSVRRFDMLQAVKERLPRAVRLLNIFVVA